MRRGAAARGFFNLADEVVVELRAFVKGQRGAEHGYDIRSLLRKLNRFGQHPRDCFFVAFDRHAAGQTDAVADEVDPTRIELLRVRRNRVVLGRKDQAESRVGCK